MVKSANTPKKSKNDPSRAYIFFLNNIIFVQPWSLFNGVFFIFFLCIGMSALPTSLVLLKAPSRA